MAKKQYPYHFRRYKKTEGGKIKKAKHPKLIVGEDRSTYEYMGLTESPKRGHHNNIPLSKNPQKGKTHSSYLRHELRSDERKNFSEPLKDYNLSSEDRKTVNRILVDKRAKKKK